VAHIDWSLEQHLGERIRRRRTELGLTQEQLAAELDISYQQIQKYESGANRISASRLYALARRMGVAVGYFFEGFDPLEGEVHGERPEHGGRQRSAIELARCAALIDSAEAKAALGALARAVAERQGH